MRLLYFAWVRTRIGIAEEIVSPPPGIDTVAALLDWLAARGPSYASALKERGHVKVAINQEYAESHWKVAQGDEVALFPPVTGG